MKIRSIFSWIVIFLIAFFVIKSKLVRIPTSVQSAFQTSVSKVTGELDSIAGSNWNFDGNQTTSAKSDTGDATPVESIIQSKELSKTYYYSYANGTSTEVKRVFEEAVASYNATNIVKLKPGPEKSWLNHIEFGTYQKKMPGQQARTLELGIGGPQIIEQKGVVSRIANHASAKLNVYYRKSVAKSVALHEIGHALGLDHSKDITSIMYPLDRGQEVLSQADLNGLKSIYQSEK